MNSESIVQYRGFTLIELVVVVMLLGILSVFAMGKLFNQNQFAAKGFFDDTVNAVRFAQKLAVSSGCAVQVQITTTGYQLFQGTTCISGVFTRAVANPANRANPYSNNNMPTGYGLTPAVIEFDARGVITSGGLDPLPVTLAGPDATFTFNVHRKTGLVDA
ncbi:MAG: prepilin-type N-terminal cleavage/methylation domain-containing protein [Gammaproteobacteria bacterium]|nr:prepilin-type N-terminal cleavage/methylation domain-containing protein [Gammaproteobacteria bacterium]